MAYKTKLEVVTKIEKDLDLEEEEFIQADEMTEYINDAITLIEAQINTLGLRDQYFLTRTTLSLVSGTADYALPTNLYEGKIKEVVYSNGSTVYGLTPMNKTGAAEQIALINQSPSTSEYAYRIRNDGSITNYFQLIPAAYETTAAAIIIEFYRDLERVSDDDDLVEVPAIALQFLYQYVKTQVYEKETHANYASSLAKLEKLEALMVETLKGQLADDKNNFIEQDLSIYEEMS